MPRQLLQEPPQPAVNSAVVEGCRITRASERTVRRWLSQYGAPRACARCSRLIEPGQWYMTRRLCGKTDRVHVACLDYALCAKPGALKEFASWEPNAHPDVRRIVKIMESLGYRCRPGQHLMVERKRTAGRHCFATNVAHGHMLRHWRQAARTGVACFNKYGQLRVIIEFAESKRTRIYDEWGVPCVLVDRECLDRMHVTWKHWIIRELRRKGIRVNAWDTQDAWRVA